MNDNFIKCRDGKDREIFPALIKHKNTVQHYLPKINTELVIMNMFIPRDSGEFSDEPYDALMEILVLAFGEKYSKEEIAEFVDVKMVAEIIDIFLDLSGYKKKQLSLQTPLVGTSSVPV